METFGTILLIILMAATAIALIAGIGLMARGGTTNAQYGNKLMVLRVTLQGATLLLLGLLFLAK
jgi:hypothetical protein